MPTFYEQVSPARNEPIVNVDSFAARIADNKQMQQNIAALSPADIEAYIVVTLIKHPTEADQVTADVTSSGDGPLRTAMITALMQHISDFNAVERANAQKGKA